MELEGRLNPSMQLPEILQFLSMGKMTGTLTIQQGNYSASLTLRHGRMINSSSIGRPRRLGQMLMNRGLVTRQAIEDTLQYQKTLPNTIPLGRLLVQRGHISIEQLRQAIRLQLEEEMWDLFSMSEGFFKFEYGDESAMGDAIVELDVEPMIIEGTRRLDEWQHIVANLPSEGVVPAVNPEADLADRDMLMFSTAEWRVLSLVNGFFDVGSLVTRSGIGKFETFRILNSLMSSDLIIVKPSNAVGGGVGGSAVRRETESSGEGFSSTRLRAVMQTMAPLTELPQKSGSSPSSQALRAAPAAPPKVDLPNHGDGEFVFRSPAGFVAGLANHVLEELLQRSDFSVGTADDRVAEQCWQTIVMQYPRADLIIARQNTVIAERLERFLECTGMEGPMKVIYDDSVEALGRFLKLLYLLAAQRLGNKEASKMIPQLFEAFRLRSVVGRSENFFFQDFASRIYS